MVKKSEIPGHLIKTAFELAAVQGWRQTRLSDIADQAKVPLVEVYRLYPSKGALLSAFARRIDEEVLAKRDPELASEPARDRVFSVMMQRYDALKPFKEGLCAVFRDQALRPFGLCCGAQQLMRSMAWMLEAAGIGSEGPCGRLRVKGLAAIHLCVMRVWFGDESEDMAGTMAVLDRHLRRVDSFLGVIRRPLRRKEPPPEPEPASA